MDSLFHWDIKTRYTKRIPRKRKKELKKSMKLYHDGLQFRGTMYHAASGDYYNIYAGTPPWPH